MTIEAGATLTIAESTRLIRLEDTIERGLKTFVEVGTALMEIRDGRLYREQHGTFEDYCRERWGFERRQAYRLIDAAAVVENVSNWTQIAPINEAQARPLTSLPADLQPVVWERAVTTAPDGKLTAAHVEKVTRIFLDNDATWPEGFRQELEKRNGGTPHVAHNSGNNEWYTPKEYIDGARYVMGGIDLDPASSARANEIVGAATYYTAEDNGLKQPWFGRVWMNPPYARELVDAFAARLVTHLSNGAVDEACVLVNNATDTHWFQSMLGVCTAVCFLRGRVRFLDPAGNPTGAPLQGQAILYFGPNRDRFRSVFYPFGAVLIHA
jgi:ParB family chromosome partitioning protein